MASTNGGVKDQEGFPVAMVTKGTHLLTKKPWEYCIIYRFSMMSPCHIYLIQSTPLYVTQCSFVVMDNTLLEKPRFQVS